MKFRKLPIEIDAIQFTGDNAEGIFEAFGAEGIDFDLYASCLVLTTTHGDPAPCRIGDWVVRDSRAGTFYPIKAEVFAATYVPC